MQESDLNRVLSCLAEGECNAVTTQYLMDRTGLSRRMLQQAIHELRLSGALICSRTDQGGGYWLAASQTELQAFVGSMDRRGKATFAAASAARKAIKDKE